MPLCSAFRSFCLVAPVASGLPLSLSGCGSLRARWVYTDGSGHGSGHAHAPWRAARLPAAAASTQGCLEAAAPDASEHHSAEPASQQALCWRRERAGGTSRAVGAVGRRPLTGSCGMGWLSIHSGSLHTHRRM